MAGPAEDHRSPEKPRQEKVGPLHMRLRLLAVLLAVLAPGAGTARAVEDVAHLQERFDKESDGVRKAKMLEKLGDAQFSQEREATKAGDFTTAGLVMEKYRDNVRAALASLKKAHPEAEKHPGGYKQL